MDSKKKTTDVKKTKYHAYKNDKIIKNWQLLECNKALNEAKSYVQMKYTDNNAMIQKTLGIIFTVLELYPRSMYIWLDMNEAFEAIDQFICTYISD